MSILFLFLAFCSNEQKEKRFKNVDYVNSFICEIENEGNLYLSKLVMDNRVYKILKSAYSSGINNIIIKGNLPISEKKIMIDTFYMTLSNTQKTNLDLILTLRKNSCLSGEFNFSAVPKSFSIKGTIEKTTKGWEVQSTSYVEID